jgi:protoheme IX farnesyltransferase
MEASILVARDTRLFGAIAKDLLNLCKPGILVLLLISTGCPMIVAASGTFPFEVFLPTILGGALLSASASTMNCIWDRDIDSIMNRTKRRPLPDGRIEIVEATVFSLILLALGVWVLWKFTNPVAALVALSGHLFYVLVYTGWLKRSTPQNIVIGGAAGAVPPIVGWAAVSGSIDIPALLLFAIIFLWTPPHFWALALNRNEDYRRASIPMMPVVAGERSTHKQMLFYAFTLLPVSWLFVYVTPQLGIISAVGLSILAGVFLLMNFKLFLLGRKTETPEIKELKTKTSWRVFSFSMIYLALLFFVTVFDSVWKANF